MRVQAYMRTTQPAFNHVLDVTLTLAENVLLMTNPYYGAFKYLSIKIPTTTLDKVVTETSFFSIDKGVYAGWDTVNIVVPKDDLSVDVTKDVSIAAPSSISGYENVNIHVKTTNKTITSNGTYTVDDDEFAGFKSVTVDVEPVLESKTITENGTFYPSSGVDGFSSVTVDVEGKTPVVEELTATTNGDYVPASGVDGYNPVHVQVPIPVLESLNVTENGTYTAEASKGYNIVTVNVPSSGGIDTYTELFYLPEIDETTTVYFDEFDEYVEIMALPTISTTFWSSGGID